VDVAVALSLVAIAATVSWREQMGLERDLALATARALVQLTILSLIVQAVFESLDWSGLVVAGMLGAATWTSGGRLSGVPHRYGRAAIAIAAGTGVSLAVLFGAGVFAFEPQFIIPISGMLIGNAMTATSLAGTRLRDEIADKLTEVEARLALGVSIGEAMRVYTRRAAAMSLIPTIDATKNVGLVFIPGAFVGMILGGASPTEAAKVQLIVMFMLLGAISVTGIVASTLVGRAFMGPGDRVVLPSEPVS
jgi:UDP-glucose/iron transport system permease protein